MSGRRSSRAEGKPAGTGFITPLIIHNGVIYIAGQGAHSHDPDGKFPTDIETHTQKVMESVKTLVETGGGAMDSILQLTVFLTLLALVLFGGDTLRHFVTILMVGVLSGTYSSIFNAAPILVVWENHEWRNWFHRRPAAPAIQS